MRSFYERGGRIYTMPPRVGRDLTVLDIFSGRGGFSRAFVDRGHNVTTLDINPRFHPQIVADVRRSRDLGHYDVVLASPPCTAFSVAAIRFHWANHVPDQHVSEGLALVTNAFRIVAEARPEFFVVENPAGMLHNLIGEPRERIFLCAYGSRWKKLTDVWGVYPGDLKLPCAPHESAPRGTHRGVAAGTTPATRAEMPYGLSLNLCLRFETGASVVGDTRGVRLYPYA